MAELVIYMGESGCGKSTSLRNLDPSKTVIISPNGKSLPFPKGVHYKLGENRVATSELDDIKGVVQLINDTAPHVNTVIIEDFSHYFSARIFSPNFLSRNQGGEAFQRWNEFGASVYQTVFADAESWREDLIIVLIHHTQVKDDGSIGFRTSGKLLDEKVDPPSYVNYVLHGVVEDLDSGTRYMVQTQKDSVRQAKSPPGCFENRIFNDMAKILDRIREYKAGHVAPEFIGD